MGLIKNISIKKAKRNRGAKTRPLHYKTQTKRTEYQQIKDSLIVGANTKIGSDINRRAKVASAIARNNEPPVVKIIKNAIKNVGIASYFIDSKISDKRQQQFERVLRKTSQKCLVAISESSTGTYIVELCNIGHASVSEVSFLIAVVEASLTRKEFLLRRLSDVKLSISLQQQPRSAILSRYVH